MTSSRPAITRTTARPAPPARHTDRTLLGISLLGAVALIVVAMAGVDSARRGDAHDFGFLTLMIGAIVIGSTQLVLHARELGQQRIRLASLPEQATDAAVDALPPPLRRIVRDRIHGIDGTSPRTTLTPYLVGLVTMLGVLDTLFRLVYAIHGPSAVALSSADILLPPLSTHRSLSAPIHLNSLTISITISTLLGLGLTLLRRSERALHHALSDAAVGPLAALSTAHRQRHSLEKTTQQLATIPNALTRTLHDMRQSLTNDAYAFHDALGQAIVSPLKQAMADALQTTSTSAAETRAFVRLTIQEHTEAEDARFAAMHARFEAMLSALNTVASERHSAEKYTADQASTQFATWHKRLDDLCNAATANNESAQQYNKRLDQLMSQRISTHSEYATRDDAHWRNIDASLVQQTTALQTAVAAIGELGDAAAARDIQRADALGNILSDGIARAADAMSQTATHAQSAITGASEQFATAVANVIKQLESTHVADMEQRQSVTASMGACTDAAGTLATKLDNSAKHHVQQLHAFERTLLAMHKTAVDAGAAHLTNHLDGIGEQLSHVTQSATSAADAMTASSAELAAGAHMLATSVDRHREAANLWLDSLGAVDSAVLEAAEGTAAEVLSQQLSSTSELFAQQLAFHRELFHQLSALRAQNATAAQLDREPDPVAMPIPDDNATALDKTHRENAKHVRA